MSNILKFLIIIGTLVVAVFVISLFFPSDYNVRRSIEIKRDISDVFNYMNDIRNWSKWTIWNAEMDTTIVYSYDGNTIGKGASQTWIAQYGDGGQEYIDVEENKSIKYLIHFNKREFESEGQYSFENTRMGTLVTWENYGDLGYDPLSKIFAYFFLEDYMSPDMEKGLERLDSILTSDTGSNE